MSENLTSTLFYVDDRNSELSILRLATAEVHQEEENLSSMLNTARMLGASPAVIQELSDLVENQPKERELSLNEVETLEGILEGTGLERQGVLANRHGIHFGMSKNRGDGTVPELALWEMVAAFASVFSVMKENSFADLTFNGVVALKRLNSDDKIALHVRDSKVSVQRASVVWETIPDLDFSGASKAKESPKPQKPKAARPGPFQQCWT